MLSLSLIAGKKASFKKNLLTFESNAIIFRQNFCDRFVPGPINSRHFFCKIHLEMEVVPMICTTIKEGMECPFMSAKGCSYNGGICHQIVEQCQGCNRGTELPTGWYCTACPEPSVKWKNGNCNLASHVSAAASATQAKINPLKASKRGNRR
jgi:hypothetical protein